MNRARYFVLAVLLVSAAAAAGRTGAYLVNPDGEAYHRPGCKFITAEAKEMNLAAASAGRRPCRTCKPPSAGPTEAKAADPAFDKKMYDELMTSKEPDEATALRQIGAKYGISAKAVDAAARRAMEIVHSGPNKEPLVRAAIEKVAKVRTMSVVADFAGISYLEEEAAWNDKDVAQKVAERMPSVLAAAFSVAGIDHVRVFAFYPAQGGGEVKAASVEVRRADFDPAKPIQDYPGFWLRRPK